MVYRRFQFMQFLLRPPGVKGNTRTVLHAASRIGAPAVLMLRLLHCGGNGDAAGVNFGSAPVRRRARSSSKIALIQSENFDRRKHPRKRTGKRPGGAGGRAKLLDRSS